MRVLSSDQVTVAVHEFGGTGRPLLFSHATGFHGHCYLPIARHLTDRFETYALDYRGHGDTPRPDDWAVDWTRYGDDALAAAEAIASNGGLIGFGHSMGGAGLLMAAHRAPELFDVIIVFEPIVFPTDLPDRGPSPLVEGARRRRAAFPGFDDAIANFASKPPMSAFDAEVLRLYVEHGFSAAPDGVHLKCAPEHEARTFESGAHHATWDLLAAIETRVVVVAGNTSAPGPGQLAASIADRLANSLYLEQPDSDHFGPFVDPAGTADLITDMTG